MPMLVASRDPLKQEIALEFCRSQYKDICILAETHIAQEQISQIRNNCLGPIIFSPGPVIRFQKAYLASPRL